jgi:amino acid transporter
VRTIKTYFHSLALPLSGWLYRINRYTQTPVNSVWFDAFFALLLGCLVFAGSQAINAVFALSITALYVAYSIPISARIVSRNKFKPGPFSLGIWVSRISFLLLSFVDGLFIGCSSCSCGRPIYDAHGGCLLVPTHT